jgi:hypothetical protein
VARQRASVLDWCVAALGVHRGALAAAKVFQYAQATRDLGHVPSHVEYARYWHVAERNGKKHRSQIQAVFGDEWEAVIERVAARMDDEMRQRDVALMSLDRVVPA